LLTFDKERQEAFMLQAMVTYKERDAVRQGLWKQYAAEDQLRQAQIKIERCLQSLKVGRPHDVSKEVPDIINYTIFAARLCDGQEKMPDD